MLLLSLTSALGAAFLSLGERIVVRAMPRVVANLRYQA